MTARDRHRLKLIEYLSNPDNDFVKAETLAIGVLGFKHRQSLYRTFTADDLQKIYQEALNLRRRKYAPEIAKVDIQLLKQAQGGDVQAAKLCYQRFEGWSEKQKHEVTGPGGAPVQLVDMPPMPKTIAEWERQVLEAQEQRKKLAEKESEKN